MSVHTDASYLTLSLNKIRLGPSMPKCFQMLFGAHLETPQGPVYHTLCESPGGNSEDSQIDSGGLPESKISGSYNALLGNTQRLVLRVFNVRIVY